MKIIIRSARLAYRIRRVECRIDKIVFISREEKKNLAELITKFKEFRHQIEDTVGKRKELLENIKFAEAELSSKKCNLTALLQLCLLKEKKMERYVICGQELK